VLTYLLLFDAFLLTTDSRFNSQVFLQLPPYPHAQSGFNTSWVRFVGRMYVKNDTTAFFDFRILKVGTYVVMAFTYIFA
jgi:hypothetical protein